MPLKKKSIKIKNRAKTRPGKTSVTIGVKIGGRKDAVIIYLFFLKIAKTTNYY